jgi:RNAse (barnase) inhibitor barstar
MCVQYGNKTKMHDKFSQNTTIFDYLGTNEDGLSKKIIKETPLCHEINLTMQIALPRAASC